MYAQEGFPQQISFSKKEEQMFWKTFVTSSQKNVCRL